MSEHLPVLQVVVPLLTAPLCLFVRNRRACRLLAIAAAWISLAIAGTLLSRVLGGETISYYLGGWIAPLGIEYRLDIVNAYVLVIVATIGSVVLPFGPGSAVLAIREHRLYLYYSAFLLCFLPQPF